MIGNIQVVNVYTGRVDPDYWHSGGRIVTPYAQGYDAKKVWTVAAFCHAGVL